MSSNAFNHFELELLRTLVTVVEHNTFAAAGVRLDKTQSAITQQMQRLESQAGVALFEKSGRSKRLTTQGHQLLQYARQMLAINDDAMRMLREGSLTGSLRIGAPHDIADTLLPQLLGHVARSAPDLRIEIHVGRSPYLMEALRDGTIDLTISTREDGTDSLDGVLIRRSPTVWICASFYRYVQGAPVPLILADEPSIFRRAAIESLGKAGVPWRPSYLSSNLIGIKAAIRAGLGVTARSIELLDADMRVLGNGEGLPELPDTPYYLWTRRNVVNPLTRQVFELLRGKIGSAVPNHRDAHR